MSNIGFCSFRYEYPDSVMNTSPTVARPKPRKLFVQPNTFIVNGEVELKEYPLTAVGVIESFIERNL